MLYCGLTGTYIQSSHKRTYSTCRGRRRECCPMGHARIGTPSPHLSSDPKIGTQLPAPASSEKANLGRSREAASVQCLNIRRRAGPAPNTLEPKPTTKMSYPTVTFQFPPARRNCPLDLSPCCIFFFCPFQTILQRYVSLLLGPCKATPQREQHPTAAVRSRAGLPTYELRVPFHRSQSSRTRLVITCHGT